MRSFILVALSGLTILGCPSTAEKRAQEGLDALERCDLRGANEAFTDAHQMDASDANIALGYALTGLVLLFEGPEMEALRPLTGFTEPIDTEFLWSKGGVLEQLQGSGTCNSIDHFVRSHIPHPAVQDDIDSPTLAATLDPTLTLGDLCDTLVNLDDRLHDLALALVDAAESVDSSEDLFVELSGGCGLNSNQIQAPELFALAAGIELVRTFSQASRAYSGQLTAQLILDHQGRENEYVSMMNNKFGQVFAPTLLPPAREMLKSALELALRAIGAVNKIKTTPKDAIIDWTKLPDFVLYDSEKLVRAAIDSLDESTVSTEIPDLLPTLRIDVVSFFERPFDFTEASPPIWSVDTYYGIYVIEDWSGLKTILGGRFSPSPFGVNAPNYNWDVADRWQNVTNEQWEAVFNPNNKWGSLYGCD